MIAKSDCNSCSCWIVMFFFTCLISNKEFLCLFVWHWTLFFWKYYAHFMMIKRAWSINAVAWWYKMANGRTSNHVFSNNIVALFNEHEPTDCVPITMDTILHWLLKNDALSHPLIFLSYGCRTCCFFINIVQNITRASFFCPSRYINH